MWFARLVRSNRVCFLEHVPGVYILNGLPVYEFSYHKFCQTSTPILKIRKNDIKDTFMTLTKSSFRARHFRLAAIRVLCRMLKYSRRFTTPNHMATRRIAGNIYCLMAAAPPSLIVTQCLMLLGCKSSCRADSTRQEGCLPVGGPSITTFSAATCDNQLSMSPKALIVCGSSMRGNGCYLAAAGVIPYRLIIKLAQHLGLGSWREVCEGRWLLLFPPQTEL